MTRVWKYLLVLAVLGAVALWLGRRPADPPPARPLPAAVGQGTAPALPAPPAAATPDTAEKTPSAPATAPSVAPPSGAARLLATIPAGPFRESLLRLDEPSRLRALEKLARLKVPREDYASLRAGPGGALLYVCDPPPPPQLAARPTDGAGAAPAATPSVAAAAVPVSTPPVRHSKPGAPNVLYLDFNGHTITGTYWNTYYGPTTYQAVAYDTDGDRTTFSDAEQAAIIQIWERVAEDYAPFNVDVTTEEPAVFTSTTGRALITRNTDNSGVAMPANTGGGVAWLEVFGQSDYVSTYSPALIYYNNLGSTANIAEAVSHELGHNLGLSHDGQTGGVEYYSGHFSANSPAWAPIMGAGYGKDVTQWSKGEYYLANNHEDDVAIISALLGNRPDEAGTTPATAAPAAVAGTAVSATGVLSSAADADVFAVSSAAGTITFTATTYRAASGTFGCNADVKLELLDAAGTVVTPADPAAADPPNSTNATLTATVAAGTYYVRLTPAGTGTPLASAPTGYTAYGSIGQYTLTGTIVPAAPAIIGTLSAGAPAGQLFNYAVAATNSPTTYAATGLPAGLALDPATGAITGRATVTGVFFVGLTATNALGSGTATLTVTIADAAPVITSQTSGRQALAVGDSLTLSVAAISANGAPTYQWKRNGFTVAGATADSLALTNATVADSGYYQVLVTNTVGTTASAVIFVRVSPAVTQVVAWGNNTNGQTVIPAGLTAVADVSAGSTHVLALKADATVTGWGSNTNGQTAIPAGLANVVAVAAGQNFSVALRADGTVAAWGRSSSSEGNQTSVPAALANVVAIAAGGFHTLALKADGTVTTWGLNATGQTNVPASLANVAAIAAGGFHSLALKSDGTVTAWGYNNNGQTAVPAGLANVVAIAAGDYFSLALKTDGTVVGWGNNTNGQTTIPAALSGVTAIAAGSAHSVALKTAGTVSAWGLNTSGQATPPAWLVGIAAVRAGSFYCVALRDASGDTTPVFAAPPQNQSAAAGSSATFAVSVTGAPPLTYQWQASTDSGASWSDLTNGGGYAGVTTTSLALTGVTVDLSGRQFRCVATNSLGTANSGAATLTVTPANQTIAFSQPSGRTYGAAPFAVTATASSGLPVTITVLSGPATVADATVTLTGAGSVTLRATQAGNASYNAATPVDRTFTVAKAALTVTAASQSRVYGAANSALTFSYSGFVNGETAAVLTAVPTIGTTAAASSPAGAYAITLTGGSADNYLLTLVPGTLTVTKAPLTITADDKTRTYGASNPAFSLSYSGFVNNDTPSSLTAPTAATTATAASNAGTYAIALTGGSAANYTLTLVPGTLAITPAAQSIAFAALADKTYGAAAFAVSATADSSLPVTFAIASGPATISGSTVTIAGAGTVTVRASQPGNGNYAAATSVDRSFTVAKAPLTITAVNQTRPYGAANPALTLGYSGFVNGDTAAALTAPPAAATTAVAASPVGSYPIALSGGTAANYALTLADGTLTVTRAPLTATADDQTRAYGAANPPLTVTYAGFVNNETAAVLTTAAVPATEATIDAGVGTYPITLTGGSADNYTVTRVAGTLTVTKAPQTIAFAAPADRTYGAASFTLDATASSDLRVDYTLVSGPASVSGSNVTLTGAGVVTIRATQSGDGSYAAATAVERSFTVAKAPLTIAAANKSRVYGAANPALTLGFSGFVNNETSAALTTLPAATTAADAASPAGTYAITLTGGSAANYALTLAGGTLTVTPAPLTVTADNQTRVYGAANPTFTLSYAGFVNNDTVAALTPPAAATTAGPASAAGAYAITVTGGSAANYTLTRVNGTLTVTKAPATVTLGGLTPTYNGSPRAATAVTSPAGLTVNFTYDASATAPTAAGTYAVVATISDPNYTGTATGTLTIAKAAAPVALSNLAQTYSGTAITVAAATTPAGLAVSFTYDGGATAPTAAGTYAVVATISDPNYTGAATGTLTIAKATAPIILANLAATYDGTAKSATAATTPAGLTVNLTYDGNAAPPTAAGSYAVAATISDANYTGTATGTLVIAKATATVSLANLAATYSGTAKTVSATTAPSGLAVTVTYAGSANAPTAAGDYAIVATVNDANYQGTATGTLTIAKAAATVTLGGLAATYDGAAKTATAVTTPAGLAVAFTYDGSATAPTNAGSYALLATVSDANYSGTATGTLVIAKAAATVALSNLAATFTGAAKTATVATTPAGLAVAVTYAGSATAPTAAGSYAVAATVADANYQGTATGTFVIAKAAATIELSNLAATYDGSAKTVAAITAPAGLAVEITYAGSATAPTAAGSYAVVATVNDPNYSGTAAATLVIAKAAATVTLASLSATYDGTAKSVTATPAPAGLAVNLTYAGNSAAPANAGDYAVVATVSDSNYQGAANGTLSIARAANVITFNPVLGVTVGNDPFAVTATASSGLPVTFSVASGPATIAGSTVTITGPGTVTIRASQSGNANYAPAAEVDQQFTVGKASQVIAFAALADRTYGAAPFAVSATASSGLTVALTVISGPATLAGGTLTLTGAGSVTLRASQAGDANFSAATEVDRTFTVGQASQFIAFAAPANRTYGAAPFNVGATSDSALPVTVTVVSGPATLANGSLTLTGAGTVVLRASQPGDANYTAATSVERSFAVAQAPLTVTAANQSRLYGAANPALTFAYAGFVNNDTAASLTAAPTASTAATAASAVGTYPITLTGGASANYTLTLVNGTLTVTKAPLTVTAANQSRLYGAANPALTIAYSGFVNNDTAAALTAAPTASTTATVSSAPGVYPITLTGGAAANYTLTLVNGTLTVTPRDYRGTYFGTFASGGHWALYVNADATATYIAYLPARHSAIVVSLTVNPDGTFTVTGTEIKPLATAVSGSALASPEAPALRSAAATGDFTLSGQIAADGTVSGALTGLGETLTGAADTGPAQTTAGLYTAAALNTASGATYTIVGASGQAVVVTTTPAAVDGAAGTVSASGQLTATTSNNAALSLTINTAAQSVSASLTPAGSTTPITYAGLSATVTPIARVVNLSVRTTAGTGDQTLIVGLVIIGSGNKTLLLRGIGPALLPQGVTNALADPTMRLLNGSGAEVSANNDWGGSAQMSANFASVGAFALPASSKDAALYSTLATGLYSFHIFPNGAGTGIALAEVYDADDDSSAASVFNISARTQVGTGENILIAGFVITGNSPKTLLIRGLGPTLAAQGVTGALINPQLYLFGSAGLVGSNDDWGGTTALKNAFAASGAGSLASETSKDAALLVTLQPGVYSAQVSGVGGTTGVGLVEIFLMP